MSRFEPIVHRYEATAGNFLVNVFLVETENGVVAVDAALAVSSSMDLRDLLQKKIKKDLIAVILTHGHPDHYTGIAELIKGYGDVPIVATQGASDQARARDQAESGLLGSDQAFGVNYPRERVFPNSIVACGESRTFDGVAFSVEDIGACESDADSIWFMNTVERQHVFVADLVYNEMHPFVKDGHLLAWMRELDTLLQRFDHNAVFHTGHGEDFGVEKFQWQKSYFEAFLRVTKTLVGDGDQISAAQAEILFKRMRTFLPNEKLLWLMQWEFDGAIKNLKKFGAI